MHQENDGEGFVISLHFYPEIVPQDVDL